MAQLQEGHAGTSLTAATLRRYDSGSNR